MTWIRLDDSHQDHPKIIGLSDKAYRLWVRAIGHSNQFRLNGDLTAATLRHIRSTIAARPQHERELIAAGLWHKTDNGIAIHDIGDYQLKSATSPEVSAKRSSAGRKGAMARWQNDGKMPLAKNAPIPAHPSPAQPIDREREGAAPRQTIDFSEIEGIGFSRFGQLGGSVVAKLRPYFPIAEWEWDAILKTNGNSWGYVVTVLKSLREASHKPRPPPAADKPQQELQRYPWEPDYEGVADRLEKEILAKSKKNA